MSQLIYEKYSPKGIVKNKNLDNSSRLILEEADKFGVDWKIIPCTKVIELNYKGKKTAFYYQVPSSTTALAKYVCNNKKITSNLLFNAGISVPHGYRISKTTSDENILSIYDDLQKPVVVKPHDGALGQNITINITDYDEYLEAIKNAFSYSNKRTSRVIVEEMFKGTEYRVLATRDKVIGILYRRPASVLGNNKDSIKTLIEEKNNHPIRRLTGKCSHLKIRMDKKMLKMLDENDMDFNSIPKKDVRVYLRKISNISQGGDAIDFTDKVHKSVKDIALQAINVIPGLSFAGIDFMSSDITKEQTKDLYNIIEINDTPGFDIHDFPYEGKNRHAAREFLYLMYPELKE